MEKPEVIVLGFVTENKHLSERVISREGIGFTLMACTHGYAIGFIIEYDDGDL